MEGRRGDRAGIEQRQQQVGGRAGRQGWPQRQRERRRRRGGRCSGRAQQLGGGDAGPGARGQAEEQRKHEPWLLAH